jgi:hypothetical protein
VSISEAGDGQLVAWFCTDSVRLVVTVLGTPGSPLGVILLLCEPWLVYSSTTKYSTINSGHHPRGPRSDLIFFRNWFCYVWKRYIDFMGKVSNWYIIHRLTGSEHETSVIHSPRSLTHRIWDVMIFPGLAMRISFVFGLSIRPNKWVINSISIQITGRLATWGKPRDRTVLSGSHTWQLWLYTCPFPVIPLRNRNREKTGYGGISIQFA